jgi:hypothetical protein
MCPMCTAELHANVNNKKKILTAAINAFMANSCRRTETINRTSIFVCSSPYSCPIFQTWTSSTDFHKTPPVAKLTELSTGTCGGFYLLFLKTFIFSLLHHSATGLHGPGHQDKYIQQTALNEPDKIQD